MRIRLMRLFSVLMALTLVSAVALAAVVSESSVSQNEAPARGPVQGIMHLLNQMAEPGELTMAHADFDTDESCTQCHTLGEGVPSSACLACHTLVGERIEQGAGWHGQVTEDCLTCHSDHEGRDFDIMAFDMPAFNHERAVWRLEGAHRDLECEECHLQHANTEDNVGWQFLGLGQECLACHSDPHEQTLGCDCQACHTPSTWEDTHQFDHESMTDFPLANLHAGLECSACHTPAVSDDQVLFDVQGDTCATCHETIEGVFSGTRFATVLGETIPEVHHAEQDCESCHSVEDRSAHLALIAPRCIECHTPTHGQQLFETARLIEESMQRFPRDAMGRITEPPFEGLSGSDLIHNPAAWIETSGQIRPGD